MNPMKAELMFPDGLGFEAGFKAIVRAQAELGTDSNVFTDRTVESEANCSLQGCVRSRAQRQITDIELGLVPLALVNDDRFTSLVRVQGVDVVAKAEAGEGAGAPGVTTAGTVSYWDPDNPDSVGGYRTVAVGELPEDITTSYTTTEVYTVTMQGSFTIGGTEAVGDPVCDPSCRVPSATATGRILQGNYTYTVVDASGDTVADLRITINLGTVHATASYTRPPNAF